MPNREEITYILVHDRMPSHDKIAPLTDTAFRLMIEAWCLASVLGKDGKRLRRTWDAMGTKNSRVELTEGGLIELTAAHATVHDYLDIQRSQVEIGKAKEKKSKASRIANHRRWHINKGVSDPECEFCLKEVA